MLAGRCPLRAAERRRTHCGEASPGHARVDAWCRYVPGVPAAGHLLHAKVGLARGVRWWGADLEPAGRSASMRLAASSFAALGERASPTSARPALHRDARGLLLLHQHVRRLEAESGDRVRRDRCGAGHDAQISVRVGAHRRSGGLAELVHRWIGATWKPFAEAPVPIGVARAVQLATDRRSSRWCGAGHLSRLARDQARSGAKPASDHRPRCRCQRNSRRTRAACDSGQCERHY
jgi:hypothetical protein